MKFKYTLNDYTIAALFICNNILISIIIQDLLLFMVNLLWMVLLYIYISCAINDSLSYQPLVLIKLFIAVNFVLPSMTIKTISLSLDKIIDCTDVYNLPQLDKNYRLLNIAKMSYATMLNNAFVKNQNAIIYIPDRDASIDDLYKCDDTFTVYCVDRSDVAPIVKHIETMLSAINEKLLVLDTIRTLYKNQMILSK